MHCFHDASLHKGRTKTKLIERDFPHHVEMIGCPLEFNLLRFGRSRPCPLWVRSGHVRCKRSCPLYPRKRTCAVTMPHVRFVLKADIASYSITSSVRARKCVRLSVALFVTGHFPITTTHQKARFGGSSFPFRQRGKAGETDV